VSLQANVGQPCPILVNPLITMGSALNYALLFPTPQLRDESDNKGVVGQILSLHCLLIKVVVEVISCR
jgi:hypothetical protein